jgi:transposase
MKIRHAISTRSVRKAVACHRAACWSPRSSGSEADLRPPRNHQRNPLHQQNRLPVANASVTFPAVAECLQSFPAHAGVRHVAGGLLQTQRTGSPKKGRNATPSYLLIDSQSVKTNGEGEERGFHGGKKIKGRSRQVATDTQGNVWAVHVHAANKSDTVEGCVLANLVIGDLPSVESFCVDQGYRGTFVNHVVDEWNREVHVSAREGRGFEIEPMRWVIERTFAWFNGQRRLGKDYEKSTNSSEAMIYISAITRNLKSLNFN